MAERSNRRHAMQNIHVNRYKSPDKVGWAGTIEPEDRSWILFIREGPGEPGLFLHRTMSDEEKKERGFDPGMTGEYVPAADWDYDTPPEPNLPVEPHN